MVSIALGARLTTTRLVRVPCPGSLSTAHFGKQARGPEFRIGQQEFMYRHDPEITGAPEKPRARQKKQQE